MRSTGPKCRWLAPPLGDRSRRRMGSSAPRTTSLSARSKSVRARSSAPPSSAGAIRNSVEVATGGERRQDFDDPLRNSQHEITFGARCNSDPRHRRRRRPRLDLGRRGEQHPRPADTDGEEHAWQHDLQSTIHDGGLYAPPFLVQAARRRRAIGRGGARRRPASGAPACLRARRWCSAPCRGARFPNSPPAMPRSSTCRSCAACGAPT